MPTNPFDLAFDALPERLAVFPLLGALLLPRGVLPLNIFEPRYLSLILDSLANDRLVGMIQPRQNAPADTLYEVGCAGRITAFQETDDGRLLINLTGLYRFNISQELEAIRGYRRVRPNWELFRNDLQPADELGVDTPSLIETAVHYFNTKKIECDWDRLKQLSVLELTNFLAMHLPFTPADKQVILEEVSLHARAKSLVTIMQMSSTEEQPAIRH
jgi:Lon protease-like protein